MIRYIILFSLLFVTGQGWATPIDDLGQRAPYYFDDVFDADLYDFSKTNEYDQDPDEDYFTKGDALDETPHQMGG